MENDETIVGCVPCVEGMSAGFVPYKNSIVGHCSQCNKSVWVGPECQKKVAQGVKIWCMICIIKKRPESLGNIIRLTDKGEGD
jgi:hypothetical protein